MSVNHEEYMRRCYELAVSAGKKGHDTFGAVLVSDGKILEEAENTADFAAGIFGHAEFNLVHKCANKYPDEIMEKATLYTSCAPCERCLGAIASLGVHHVVCGVSYKEFCRLLPFDYRPLDREGLLKQLGIRMKLEESVLEEEGMHVFEWWGGEYRPLEELIAEMDEVKKHSSGNLQLQKAGTSDALTLNCISKQSFDTDVEVGAPAAGGPPGYMSLKYHMKMARSGYLYKLVNQDGLIVGGAILFPDGDTLNIGRIFVSPEHFHKGYGKFMMQEIEAMYPDVKTFTLDTPVWNTRTNAFYAKLGYTEVRRSSDLVWYSKER